MLTGKPLLLFPLLVAIGTSIAGGQIVTLDATDRGWYDSVDFHDELNTNYFVGDGRGPIGFSDLGDARNFFVFDLSAIETQIQRASLSLYLPFVDGFFTADDSETYQLVEVSGSVVDLIFAYGSHADLGTGTVYATYDLTAWDGGGQVVIPLNDDAIAALNAADGLFAFGGSITTLNQYPDDEYAFAFTSEPDVLTQLIIDMSDVNGDFNGDMLYDCSDVDALVGEIAAGSNNSSFDLHADALVNRDDLDAWLAAAGAANLSSGLPYLPGDANLDGLVDVSDFNRWNTNKFTSTAAWCSGDFNADGVVDVQDFNIFNGHKFTSSSGLTAVPEPAAWGLVGWVSLCLVPIIFRRARARITCTIG